MFKSVTTGDPWDQLWEPRKSTHCVITIVIAQSGDCPTLKGNIATVIDHTVKIV